MPDNTIFQIIEFKFEILAARLRELAFLNKNILLTLTDKREIVENGNGSHPATESFFSERGLQEFVEYLDVNRERLIDKIIYIDYDKGDTACRDCS